jgi:iron complex transport system substrate-binding protein
LRRIRFLCFGIAFVLLAACQRTEERRPAMHDDIGRSLVVPAHVRRVVTLAPNVTELLFAMGAGAKIVGTDDFSNFPKAAGTLPKVGGMQPNIEKIVQLAPDLVLASTEGNHPNLARALAAAKIPLYVVRTDRLAEIAPAMQRFAALLGVSAEPAANALNAAVNGERRTRTPRPRVMFAVWTDPLYVAGRATYIDDLYELTGATNAVSVTGWPQYSLESFAAAPPDVLLYPRGSVSPEQVEHLLARIPGHHTRVVAVDQDVFQRPGPRMAEAAKTLNAILDIR